LKQTDYLYLEYFGTTDIGLVRNENQDSFGKYPQDSDDRNQPKGLLFIVADGMGGHIGGKDASNLAIQIVSREYYSFDSEIVSNCLKYAFKTANFRIYQSSKDEMQSHRKGTTCSTLVIEKNLAFIAHVGDSRIYRINSSNIEQMTNDHTQVEEMLRKGILSESEAKNHPSKSILVRALGIESEVEVDVIENIPINNGDNFVICSDGLAKVFPEEIKGIVLSNSAEDACNELIKLANERGGHDNVTVQVIRINSKDETMNNSKPVTVIKSRSFPKKTIVISLILVLIIILAFIFQKNIIELFEDKSSDDISIQSKMPDTAEVDASADLFANAEKFLSEDNLDSALFSFRLILQDNPMHVGALNGIEIIADKFTEKGNLNKQQRNFNLALENYQRAAELKPNDKNIASLIAVCKKEIKKESELNKKSKDDNLKNNKNSEPGEQNPDEQYNSNLILSSFMKSEWSFNNLSENDYFMDQEVLTFFSSGKLKKGYFNQKMEDVDVKVNLILPNKSSAERAGIIVGYNGTDRSSELYFLFSADIFGNFLLQKYSNGEEEKLVSVQKKIMPVNNTYRYSLKIKCLGPWIMIYNDDRLLESWLNKDFVKGKIGLFADSGTNAEFSEFKVTSAFENR
jgi:protein phosphatase